MLRWREKGRHSTEDTLLNQAHQTEYYSNEYPTSVSDILYRRQSNWQQGHNTQCNRIYLSFWIEFIIRFNTIQNKLNSNAIIFEYNEKVQNVNLANMFQTHRN